MNLIKHLSANCTSGNRSVDISEAFSQIRFKVTFLDQFRVKMRNFETIYV